MKYFATILLTLSLTLSQGQSSKTSPPLSRDSINLALSYGAEANDLLRIAIRMLENQKAEIDQVYAIVDNKGMQVEVLTKTVEVQKKQTFWQKLWAWVRGAIAGAATYVVVQSLVK